MKIRIIFVVIALTLAIITTTFVGCSFDRWVEVTEGDYTPVDARTAHEDSLTSLIESITVDRDKDALEVRLREGAIVNTTLTARPKAEWPSGCPANIGSTRMEVLDLDIDKLIIGPVVIEHPVLVRNCPRDPEEVILREDGQMGGGSTACARNSKCIHLRPSSSSGLM